MGIATAGITVSWATAIGTVKTPAVPYTRMGDRTAAVMSTHGTVMCPAGVMRARAAAKVTCRGMSTTADMPAPGMTTTTSGMPLGDNRCRDAQHGAQNTRSRKEASTFGTHGNQSPITPNVYNAAGANWCTTPTQFSRQFDRSAALNIM